MAAVSAHPHPAPRVGLIGCGAIGSLLDEAQPHPHSLTHAAAIVANGRFRFVGVADADTSRAEACARARGAERAFGSAEALVAECAPDLLVIAAPPAGRAALVERALASGVSAFFCEKPLAVDVDEGAAIAAMIRDAGAVCAVNYLRRWAPIATRLRVHLDALGGAAGLQRVQASYGKGIANNASHLIDLLTAVLGRPVAVQALPPASAPFGADESFDALLRFEIAGRTLWCSLAATDHREYTLLECDLVHAAGRLRMLDSGRRLEVQRVAPDPEYAGYRHLAPHVHEDGCLEGALDVAYAQWPEILAGRAAPACDERDGLAVLRVIDALRRSRTTGRECEVEPTVDVQGNHQSC